MPKARVHIHPHALERLARPSRHPKASTGVLLELQLSERGWFVTPLGNGPRGLDAKGSLDTGFGAVVTHHIGGFHAPNLTVLRIQMQERHKRSSRPKTKHRQNKNLDVRLGIPVNTVGKRIRHAREQRGIKQTDFARMLGITSGGISQLESREGGDMRGSTLARICQILEVRPEWVMWGEGEQRSPALSQQELSMCELYRAAPVGIRTGVDAMLRATVGLQHATSD